MFIKFLFLRPVLIKQLHEAEMNKNIITINPKQCGGQPCIRGMRIRVVDVLDLLGNGLSSSEIIKEFPELTEDDIKACIKYASSKRMSHKSVKFSYSY